MKRNLKKKLDDLWRKAVKLKANNRCEICAINNEVESHHFVRRGILSTRFLLENGICLCIRHHKITDSHKKEFEALMIKKRGQEWFDKLMELKKVVKPILNTGEIERELNEVIKSQRD